MDVCAPALAHGARRVVLLFKQRKCMACSTAC
jgi:hypothetical protein